MRTRLDEFRELWPAEEKLRQEVHTGRIVPIGADRWEATTVPSADAPQALRIRATFLAYLARGGCDACRPGPKGVQVAGAYIESDGDGDETPGLDLEGCTLPGALGLLRCRFPDTIHLLACTLPNLYLDGSHLLGGETRKGADALSADRLVTRGGAFLRAVAAKGEVRLLGARLGGDLDCDGAQFTALTKAEDGTGNAFHADGLEAKGNAFLQGVTARGEVKFLNARLGGDLDCDRAQFTALTGAEGGTGFAFAAEGLEATGSAFLRGVTAKGVVRLHGARLGGDLDCEGAQIDVLESDAERTLGLVGIRVAGGFLWRRGPGPGGKRPARSAGVMDLTDAEFGHLNDDAESWPGPGRLILDRCRYGAITSGPVTASERLDWLARQRPERVGADFWPQPYEQLARVFREAGHAAEARAVLVEKERLQREWRRTRIRARLAGARHRLAVEWCRNEGWARDALGEARRALTAGWAAGDPRRGDIRNELARIGRPVPLPRVVGPRSAVARVGTWLGDRAVGRYLGHWVDLQRQRLWDGTLGLVTGYGRRPEFAFLWLVGVWAVCAIFFQATYASGAFKPNNAFVLRAPEWVLCGLPETERVALPSVPGLSHGLAQAGESQLRCYERQPEAANWPAFNAWWYSADVLVPLVSLEMQEYWLPDETKPGGGWARWVHWLEIVAGWVLATLAVAGFSGLIKSD